MVQPSTTATLSHIGVSRVVCGVIGSTSGLHDLLGGASSHAAPAAPSTSNLADLLGGDHPPQASTSSSTSGFADLLSQATPTSAPQFEPFTAFEKDGIRVVFRASKPAGQEAITDITASYSNASGEAITDFSLQVSICMHDRDHAVVPWVWPLYPSLQSCLKRLRELQAAGLPPYLNHMCNHMTSPAVPASTS